MVPMELTGNFSLAPMAVIGAIVGANDLQWRHSYDAIGDSDSGVQWCWRQ